MKRADLLALADQLNEWGFPSATQSAAILRQIAEAQPVAWINKDRTYVELSTKSTVYGSHTIPLIIFDHEEEPESLLLDELMGNHQLPSIRKKPKALED